MYVYIYIVYIYVCTCLSYMYIHIFAIALAAAAKEASHRVALSSLSQLPLTTMRRELLCRKLTFYCNQRSADPIGSALVQNQVHIWIPVASACWVCHMLAVSDEYDT